jgi:hypothetical protein
VSAELEERANEHRWRLSDRVVTQLVLDPSALRLHTWAFDGSAEIRFAAPFQFSPPTGPPIMLDPEQPRTLTPALELLNRTLSTIVVRRSGELEVTFADGTRLRAAAHPRFEAWEITGSGSLEDLSYLARPGGGAPWG